MKKTIEEISPACKADFALALETVSDLLKVSRKKLLSKSRITECLMGRAMLYSLMDYTDKHDYASIGAFFGKDHSTVLHGLREHAKMYKQDYNEYQNLYDLIFKSFKGKLDHDVQGMTVNEKSHYEILNKIDLMIDGLTVIRNSVLDDYISGIPMSQKLKEKLVEAFFVQDPSEHTTGIEKEISKNLFTKKDKYD